MNGVNRFIVGCECNPRRSTRSGGRVRRRELRQTALPKVPRFIRPLIVGAATAQA